MAQAYTDTVTQTNQIPEYPVAKEQHDPKQSGTTKNYKIGPFELRTEPLWVKVIEMGALHIAALYAMFTFDYANHKMLVLWAIVTGFTGIFGITAGAHRLWTHKSYKANVPLRIILLGSFLVNAQVPVSVWVREHTIHHKYVDTDGDPLNSTRGLFYSHVGWLIMKSHPEAARRRKQVDMSDIENDSILQFGEKYFYILALIIGLILPVVIPVYFWNEEWYPTIVSQWLIRFTIFLNFHWSVNSFAHAWGTRGYDKSIRPTENPIISFVTLGEGWHNFHHSFPWDYKAGEFGNYKLNVTTMLIDAFAKIGWATDLKEASSDLVKRVVENRGDGTHSQWGKPE